MKTKRQILFLFLILSIDCFSQSLDQINLEKYWQYRDRHRQQFTKIGTAPGESLVIKARQINERLDVPLDNHPLANGHAIIAFDDMIEHGYYLMVLSTEYELLKNAGQDLTAVKNELYYALNAVNRVDLPLRSICAAAEQCMTKKIERYHRAYAMP